MTRPRRGQVGEEGYRYADPDQQHDIMYHYHDEHIEKNSSCFVEEVFYAVYDLCSADTNNVIRELFPDHLDDDDHDNGNGDDGDDDYSGNEDEEVKEGSYGDIDGDYGGSNDGYNAYNEDGGKETGIDSNCDTSVTSDTSSVRSRSSSSNESGSASCSCNSSIGNDPASSAEWDDCHSMGELKEADEETEDNEEGEGGRGHIASPPFVLTQRSDLHGEEVIVGTCPPYNTAATTSIVNPPGDQDVSIGHCYSSPSPFPEQPLSPPQLHRYSAVPAKEITTTTREATARTSKGKSGSAGTTTVTKVLALPDQQPLNDVMSLGSSGTCSIQQTSNGLANRKKRLSVADVIVLLDTTTPNITTATSAVPDPSSSFSTNTTKLLEPAATTTTAIEAHDEMKNTAAIEGTSINSTLASAAANAAASDDHLTPKEIDFCNDDDHANGDDDNDKKDAGAEANFSSTNEEEDINGINYKSQDNNVIDNDNLDSVANETSIGTRERPAMDSFSQSQYGKEHNEDDKTTTSVATPKELSTPTTAPTPTTPTTASTPTRRGRPSNRQIQKMLRQRWPLKSLIGGDRRRDDVSDDSKKKKTTSTRNNGDNKENEEYDDKTQEGEKETKEELDGSVIDEAGDDGNEEDCDNGEILSSVTVVVTFGSDSKKERE